MTFVVGAAVGEYAFMASDRLVSLGGKSYEPQSNKNVILLAREGIVSIGYTGLAYMGHKPMDMWIAETAVGAQLGVGIGIGPPPPFLWEVADRLRSGLEKEFQKRNLTKYPTEILIVGLRVGRQRARHVLWSIVHDPTTPGVVQWVRQEDRWLTTASFHRHWIGQSDPGAVKRMLTRLRAKPESPDAFETVLSDAVVETGQAYPGTVGQDVMSILISPGDSRPRVSITYRPRETVHVSSFDGIERPAAYSPWILMGGFWFSPALVSGQDGNGWTNEIMEVTVRNAGLISAPNLNDPVSTWGSVKRRSAPSFSYSVAASIVTGLGDGSCNLDGALTNLLKPPSP